MRSRLATSLTQPDREHPRRPEHKVGASLFAEEPKQLRRSALPMSWLCVASMLLVACSPAVATDPLEVSNQTTIEVGLFVNGTHVADLRPLATAQVPSSELPAPPWHVEARTAGGRVLLTLDVGPDPVRRSTAPNGGVSIAGAGIRAELSCGQIDLWVGPPLLGPAPGPGTPGDCNP
jgi:hypothetical protein